MGTYIAWVFGPTEEKAEERALELMPGCDDATIRCYTTAGSLTIIIPTARDDNWERRHGFGRPGGEELPEECNCGRWPVPDFLITADGKVQELFGGGSSDWDEISRAAWDAYIREILASEDPITEVSMMSVHL